jgi:hypothetical protein
MAIKEKTIEFSTPTFVTTVAVNTVTNLAQITAFIPEASPTFTSVFAELSFRDIATSACTITEHRIGMRLNAAAYTTTVELDDIYSTGESIGGVVGPFDFTAHFNANWAGASSTIDTQVFFLQAGTGPQGLTNISVKWVISYNYDDTSPTQIKTVRIPLESFTSVLPLNSSTALGLNQIPRLTGTSAFLPEANAVIRDYFFVIEGNENSANNVTDWLLSVSIGAGPAFTFAPIESGQLSDVFMRWIYKPDIPSTTVTHQLRIWGSPVARANHITVTLHVTYEFTLAGTTRTLNSVILPIEIASPLGANTPSQASRFQREVMIVDPGVIDTRQSAIRINYNTTSSGNHSWRVNNQSYRTYTGVANVVCGMFSVQQRIDVDSAAGTGVTLVRGKNTITIDGYGSSTIAQLTNIGGYILLNYESDVATQGIGSNSKTLLRNMLQWDAALTDRNRINSWNFPILAENYWLMGSGFCFIQWVATGSEAITFDVECLAGEGKGAGYIDLYADAYQADSERSCSLTWMRGRDAFKRFPQDADLSRLDLEIARAYRLFTTSLSSNGIFVAVTYHSITFTVAGNLLNGDAGLATNLKLINAVTSEVMQVQTIPAGTTAFSFTVYDNTEDYYIDAFQNSSYLGRSTIGKAA